jgi:uncharacterized protein (TIGR00661 family)
VSIPYYRLEKKNHRIAVGPTFRANWQLYTKRRKVLLDMYRQLVEGDFDGVIADYEPFVSRAALRLGLPLVNFCHQAVLDRHPGIGLPAAQASIANRIMMPVVPRYTVSSSFFDGDLGPIIRREIVAARGRYEQGDHVLVYASKSIRENLPAALPDLPQVGFEIYPREDGDFVRDLASARGVIAPAGHQMLSEALYLGLPVLAFPQAGQYEQLLNARMLERSGMGMSGTLGTAEADVRDFVSKLDEFPLHEPDPRIRFLFANDAEAAATKLERLIQEQRRRVRPGAAVRRLLNSGEAA